MPDIATITSALSSIKTATDIVKYLRESGTSLEQAEMRLKLADAVVALADAKMEIVDIQELLLQRDQRIAELEEAFQTKDSLVRRYDAYYICDAEGNPTGSPYCFRCWEVDHKKRQLVRLATNRHIRVCTDCGHQYGDHLAGDIQPNA